MTSVGLTAAACTRIRTSPAPGTGSGRSITRSTSGPPNSVRPIARMCGPPLSIGFRRSLPGRNPGGGGIAHRPARADAVAPDQPYVVVVAHQVGLEPVAQQEMVLEVDRWSLAGAVVLPDQVAGELGGVTVNPHPDVGQGVEGVHRRAH